MINSAEPNYLSPLTICCHVPSHLDPASQPLDLGLCLLCEKEMRRSHSLSNLSLYTRSSVFSLLSLLLRWTSGHLMVISHGSLCGRSVVSAGVRQSLRLLVAGEELGFVRLGGFVLRFVRWNFDLVWGDFLVEVLVVWGLTLSYPSVLPWILFWKNRLVLLWRVMSQESLIYCFSLCS